MTARPDHLTTSLKLSLASELLADPHLNKSELARQAGLSRQTLYNLAQHGEQALSACFSPHSPPPPLHQEGYWIWVDASLIKRGIVLLRASCGASFASIAVVLFELLGLRISHGKIWSVVQESYQRAFKYMQSVSLKHVVRAAFDEMYRWDRCELVGVDCDSHFIFLAEKQPSCSALQWAIVMERLQTKQGLNPAQIGIDGLSSLELAAKTIWEKARLAHDINHPRRALDKVQAQFEGMAYKAMSAAEEMKKRCARGPTRRTKQAELDLLLLKSLAREMEAVTKAELVSDWIGQAQAAFNVVHPETGKVQEVSACQRQLKEVATKLSGLGTCDAKDAAAYLNGLGQEIIAERVVFQNEMKEIAKQACVSFETVEAVVHLLELGKQRAGAPWPGTKELIWKKMLVVQAKLKRMLGSGAVDLFIVVSVRFRKLLAASSAAEGSIQRLSAVMYPQKRASSGFLQLRAAYLNLSEIEEGLRKGHSSHELMSGEKVSDWLEKLGYERRQNETRSLKKLGWKRLIQPYLADWKRNYGEGEGSVSLAVMRLMK